MKIKINIFFVLAILLLAASCGGMAYFFAAALSEIPARNNIIRLFIAFFTIQLAAGLIWNSKNKILKAFSWLTLLLIPAAAFCLIVIYRYFKKLHAGVTATDIYAVLQTDSAEATDFLITQMFTLKSVMLASLFALLALLVILLFCFALKKALIKSKDCINAALFAILAVSAFLVAANLPLFKMVHNCMVTYDEGIAQFNEFSSKLDALEEKGIHRKAAGGELYVLIIGESAGRDFLHAYTGVPDNTPWMDSLEEPAGWIKYRNAYSSNTHTVPSLCAALTDGRTITGLTYPNSLSIVTLSKLAGFKTTWLSNQAPLGSHDTPISALAASSDTVRFTRKMNAPMHDEAILPLLEEALAGMDLTENNLLVIHLAGSHAPFQNYPERFDVQYNSRKDIGAAADPSSADEEKSFIYFNRYTANLKYTDHVLEAVFKQLSRYADLPLALIYFADHGADVFAADHGHNFIPFTWSKARIPMLIWLSERYRAKYPEKSAYLHSAREKIFTNDLIFDLYAGLAGIEFDGYQPEYDLGAPEYIINEENAVIVTGKRISSDPLLRAAANAALETDLIIAAHRSNSLFKAKQAIQFGIKNLEIDLVYAQNGESEDLMIGHDLPTLTGANFAEYLTEMQDGLEFLWVDIKNLNNINAQAIYAQFSDLDAKYGLKNRLLIESGDPDAASVFARNGWATTYYLPWQRIIETAQLKSDAEVKALSRDIADKLEKSGVTGVSYDFAADEAVRKYLLPELPSNIKCYAWQMGWNYADMDLSEKLGPLTHLSVLLISFNSPFTL